jgi:hypothetical protein
MGGDDYFLGEVITSLKDKDIVVVEFKSEVKFSIGQHLIILHGLAVAGHADGGSVHAALFRGDLSGEVKATGFLLPRGRKRPEKQNQHKTGEHPVKSLHMHCCVLKKRKVTEIIIPMFFLTFLPFNLSQG